ncbi:MAG: hydroxyacid dehydrogenase [Hyphomicrobiales bacterium]|nr:hydroxyacid dehydrogenase [Hyphomicrobiales bacterium]MDE2113508.1 hydroxyacid dehydrogenase [Hyphomicrobiales bacterium]
MATIVISEFMDEAAVEGLARHYPVLYHPGLVDRPQDLANALNGARAWIVRNRSQVRGQWLEAGAQLEVIGRLGVGLDNIDLAACKARNIAVCPATGANDIAVAEYVIGACLQLVRRAFAATPTLVAGAWPREALGAGGEIHGRTLGLIGFGAIARETARRAHAFGMNIIAHDPFVPNDAAVWLGMGVRPATLPQLLADADIISLHVPLTDETRNIINAASLGEMKQGAILINAARGGIVEEVALAAALRSGKLGGAALDVFDQEPVTADRGAIFAGIDHLILTPHIAGVTHESNIRVSALTASNVLRVLNQKSENP